MGLTVLTLLFAVFFSACISQNPPPIPTLPRSFGTDFKLSLNVFNGGYPFLEGTFAVDYDGLGGMLYIEDSPEGAVPYRLETSVIGHPQPARKASDGYLFLNEGRCWLLGNLGESDFHYIPLAIPADATFLTNVTINGELCGQWTWTGDLSGFFSFQCFLAVRYSDNAPLIFELDNKEFFPFILTIQNSRFFLNPTKGFFDVPPGPCANHSWNAEVPESSPLSSLFSLFSSSKTSNKLGFIGNLAKALITTKYAQHGFINYLFGNYLPKTSTTTEKKVAANAPAPPSLHQYFLSDYEFGYGGLVESNGFKPPDSLFRGQMSVDKEVGGFYIDIADNQEADVPFQFSSSGIIHPTDDKGNITAYWFLRTNRCWLTTYPLINPDFPLQIPDNATFAGTKTIYGKPATLWQFDGSFEGYDAAIQIAVSSSDKSIIFITLSPNFEGYDFGTYLIFNNFNASKPEPATYGIPSGFCWDPTHQGPPE